MNILVTGGAGFIGSNVVDKYIENGFNVIIIDNLSTGKKENLNKSAVFYEMDIRDKNVEKIFKEYKIDIINHLAAQIDVRKSVSEPIFDADVNILGGINILETAIKYNVKKIIYSSTGGAIYGEPEYLPADEAHPVRPLAGYGVSKHALEHYIELFSFLYNIDYTMLRYGNVYGPRQDPLGEAGVIAIFTGKMLDGERPVIFGDGEQTRDFIYVGDVADANIKAINKGSRKILNIGTGRETSVNQIFDKMKKILNFSEEPIYAESRPGEVFKIFLDIKSAKTNISWEPSMNLEEGLRKTIEFTKAATVKTL